MFAHEKLKVYRKALDFAAKTAVWVGQWDKRHALVDHLIRAAESVVSNLAEAARQQEGLGKLKIADYAIGSSLECAGCMDVARIKGLLTKVQSDEEKTGLCEITKMLIGLRKAWASSAMREEPLAYQCESPSPLMFHHESLAVYQSALAFMVWFVDRTGADSLSQRAFRQIDEAGTRVVLNIAEGNGRYAELDHRRFIQIAQSGAVKAAVYLDLSIKAGLLKETEAALGKEHLDRISTMLAGF